MKRVILLLVLILLISSGFMFAAVPGKINYQGRLIKDGVPVDGTRTMRFSIYNSAVGGTQLWTSGDTNVTVYNGLFRYVLDLSTIDWAAGETLYLEVKVETDILTPREEIYGSPYAINSHLLEGVTKEYFLNTSGETQTKQGNLNITGNVGIGTTEPGEKLTVAGTIESTTGGVKFPDGTLQTTALSVPTITVVNADINTTYTRNHNGLVVIEAHYVGYQGGATTISVTFLVNGISRGGINKAVNYIVMPSPTFTYSEVMSGTYTFRVNTTNLEKLQLQFVITEY